MQDEGVIAPDEPFMYFSIFDTTPDGRLGPSFALDQEARLAMFEMIHRKDIPPVVSINEAIEIAKKFSTAESGKFVNGLLDRVKKELLRPARQAAG